MISCLILTLDEEVNIEACIRSLPWRDDIYVLDSCSSDSTPQKANELGAHVISRKFTDYADQRNFGLALPFKHDWIVMIDADERMTTELAREIEEAVNRSEPFAMMLVRRKDIFLGRWLRRSSGYPTWFPRVIRRNCVRVLRVVNEEYEARGDKFLLKEHLVHLPFNKGVEWWYTRHNIYSTFESTTLAQKNLGLSVKAVNLFSQDPLKRRAAAKQILYRLPMRPFWVFIYLYIFKFGFLDGVAGYQYALMRLSYEIMIDAKSSERAFRSTLGR